MSKNKKELINPPIRIQGFPCYDDERPEAVIKRTLDKIQKGAERKTAGTGIPMDNLHGGARTMALLSNVGGGSKENGGGGVKDGFETFVDFSHAKGQLDEKMKKDKDYIEEEKHKLFRIDG